MTNPYRAICAELVEKLHEHTCLYEGHESELVTRARALLAQPEPEGPTDAELWALGSDDFRANYYPTDAIAYARAVLARWGNPTPQPVAEGPTIPSHYRGHGIAVYRDGFHAGYKEALARSANAPHPRGHQ